MGIRVLAFVLLFAGRVAPQDDEPHGSFINPAPRKPPAVENASWVRNPIDRFILARLEKAGLSPSPEASRRTLLRRASLDLIGLPPTPEEVEGFVSDPSPDAFEKVVDRLLKSEHYGERWARHWLDLARYAESEGFKKDETRPNAWRYRDYVIRSFNRDKPYDRFIREQIAGDELWPDDLEAGVTTAFNRHYPDESNGRNVKKRRQEVLDDITNTVGSVFLALTFECSRCHDHKYDPFPQSDYYRLQAFFANIRTADDRAYAPPGVVLEYKIKRAAWDDKTRAIREERNALAMEVKSHPVTDLLKKYPDEIREAVSTAPSEGKAFKPRFQIPVGSGIAGKRSQNRPTTPNHNISAMIRPEIPPPHAPLPPAIERVTTHAQDVSLSIERGEEHP